MIPIVYIPRMFATPEPAQLNNVQLVVLNSILPSRPPRLRPQLRPLSRRKSCKREVRAELEEAPSLLYSKHNSRTRQFCFHKKNIDETIWRCYFEIQSQAKSGINNAIRQGLHQIWAPLTIDPVVATYPGLSSAPGPGGLRFQSLRELGPKTLTTLYNCSLEKDRFRSEMQSHFLYRRKRPRNSLQFSTINYSVDNGSTYPLDFSQKLVG